MMSCTIKCNSHRAKMFYPAPAGRIKKEDLAHSAAQAPPLTKRRSCVTVCIHQIDLPRPKSITKRSPSSWYWTNPIKAAWLKKLIQIGLAMLKRENPRRTRRSYWLLANSRINDQVWAKYINWSNQIVRAKTSSSRQRWSKIQRKKNWKFHLPKGKNLSTIIT